MRRLACLCLAALVLTGCAAPYREYPHPQRWQTYYSAPADSDSVRISWREYTALRMQRTHEQQPQQSAGMLFLAVVGSVALVALLAAGAN